MSFPPCQGGIKGVPVSESAMARVYNRKEQIERRRELRSNMPKAEVLLWTQLQRRQLMGYKFRRQYGVGLYILDFYCPELKLGIELDGDSHYREGGQEYDAQRDEYVKSFGIRVVRILNDEVYKNLDGVIEQLAEEVSRREALKELRDEC